MLVLTPSGYVDPHALPNGAAVCAFDDANSGQATVNYIENIDLVDYAEWCRWWQVEPEVPSFDWYRINGGTLLFREQSVWRNGTNVCHARDLVVGDTIYDDHDDPVVITSIDKVTDESLLWYRFDISGDHSYIVDGLTVHNASRFWVSGTGTWDSTTTHWASATGGTGGQTVPGSADTVTFDGSSGGGTVTLNFGGTITVQSITTGAFTGTWDNSVNNNNVTMSSTTGFNASGSATRTLNLGSATYTLTNTGTTWNFLIVTGLTLSASSSSVTFTSATGVKTVQNATALSQGTLNLGATNLSPAGGNHYIVNGGGTWAAINVTAPNFLSFQFSSTITITSPINWAGSASGAIGLGSSSYGSQAHIKVASGSQLSWCALHDIDFSLSNSPNTYDCLDLGDNAGITIVPPSGIAPQPMVIGRGTPY